MIDCMHCKEVNKPYAIKRPADLKKAFRVAQSNLNDGTIIESEYWPEGIIKIGNNTPFNKVTGNGAYTEDIYIYYFECPQCHRLYELSCETYHGSGGVWKPLDKINN